ncbi:siderophore-interacting protein [Microbacterium protaetiae]|uniref:Siderophore-interacting protein n=1 Tax=Microbacterium protaetiae TaxID=2509458 RepID=A0A4P6EPF6_9MICO|nr:siderophore-interacting protein [Microbacterium protaetiae]QAY59848.1 siderophore-interacting protein [Microbacterium protaetiae]
MTDAATEASTLFYRAGGRNRFTAREAIVTAVSNPTAEYVRVTLTGPDFGDFPDAGPSDHVRTFFPDPATGELVAPVAAGPGQDGITRPDRATFGRDFTPLNVRDENGRRLVDIDILRHESPGPAAQFGAQAVVGSRLVLVGPRGSRQATQNAPRVVLVVDGTSLPAAGRWLADVPASTTVEIIASAFDLDAARAYLRTFADREFALHAAGDDLIAALTAVGVDASSYVFAAGEASTLVPLRRHLRHTLALPREQYTVSGYWRQGVEAWDHHAPIDPADPD